MVQHPVTHTVYLPILKLVNPEKSTFLPAFNSANIVEAWKVSHKIGEILQVSNHIFHGADKHIKDEVLENLSKTPGLEKEKMVVPGSKTWKIYCTQVTDSRFPFGRFSIEKSSEQLLVTKGINKIRC